MSKRRKPGDWVWLAPNTGFVGESNRLRAQIPTDPKWNGDEWEPCLLNCGDPDCREWPNLFTEPDPRANGKSHCLCHVSECEMFDDPQKDTLEREQ